MTKINIGGENYKVRQREVDGKKQEILYKNGDAYIKNSSGQLERLNKQSDGIFTKASYTTQAHDAGVKLNHAENLNTRFNDTNRPELSGLIDAGSFVNSDDIVGYKGRFTLADGDVFNGVIFRDPESNTNKVRSDRNSESGVNISTVYALKQDTSEFFVESRTITRPDGSTIQRAFNYDTGEYDTHKL